MTRLFAPETIDTNRYITCWISFLGLIFPGLIYGSRECHGPSAPEGPSVLDISVARLGEGSSSKAQR